MNSCNFYTLKELEEIFTDGHDMKWHNELDWEHIVDCDNCSDLITDLLGLLVKLDYKEKSFIVIYNNRFLERETYFNKEKLKNRASDIVKKIYAYPGNKEALSLKKFYDTYRQDSYYEEIADIIFVPDAEGKGFHCKYVLFKNGTTLDLGSAFIDNYSSMFLNEEFLKEIYNKWIENIWIKNI